MAAWDFQSDLPGASGGVRSAAREDLRRAVKGTLADYRATSALRAQSQVNFGAQLVAAGLFPAAPPTTGGPSPDYVVTLDTLPIASEVKRPETMDTIAATVSDAIGQMEDFGSQYQALHLDMTDVVGDTLSQTGIPRGEADLVAAFRTACEATSLLLHGQVEQRVITSYCSVHYCFWSRIDGLRVYHASQVQLEAFPQACSGLVIDQGRKLRRAILAGASAFGIETVGLRAVE